MSVLNSVKAKGSGHKVKGGTGIIIYLVSTLLVAHPLKAIQK